MKKNLVLLFLLTCITVQAQVHKGLSGSELRAAERAVFEKLTITPEIFEPYLMQSQFPVRLQRVACSEGRVNLYFNATIVHIAIREELCKNWENLVRETLGEKYKSAAVGIFFKDIPIERYIPNYYRKRIAKDRARTVIPSKSTPLVRNLDAHTYTKGLQNRHISLFSSHGYHLDMVDTTWRFQRPALFGTIEDIHSHFIVENYLAPMLENAGALTFSPRERDTTRLEIIQDNTDAKFSKPANTVQGGFKQIAIIKDTINPFELGTYAACEPNAVATYKFHLPQPTHSAVYISYKSLPNNSDSVLYTVTSSSKTFRFAVNQKIGGGWIMLDKIPLQDTVTLTVTSAGNFTTDAIRIGAGMGNTERIGKISGMPKWIEGARYNIQYNGLPPSVYKLDEENEKVSDYMDDFKSRGFWVNHLKHQWDIPIDLSLAVHTNAGIEEPSFGSLTINYTDNGKDKYENKKSKFASRDFADIVLTQLTDDIQKKYCPTWARKSMYDRQYAEVSRPDVPSLILELFSHQNLSDMKFGLDPQFRFDIARATYKGVVRFMSTYYGTPYQIQPLPVRKLYFAKDSSHISLNWTPTTDPLEPTAIPDYYTILTSSDTRTWHTISQTTDTKFILPHNSRKLTHYKVVAHNDGGQSFGSEILTTRAPYMARTLVIIDMLQASAPDTVKSGRGFDMKTFRPKMDDYSIVGDQRNFDFTSEFVDNSCPGWGFTDMSSFLNVRKPRFNPSMLASFIDPVLPFTTINTNQLISVPYNPDNVIVITDKPIPITKEQLEIFLGFTLRIEKLNYLCI